MYLAGQRGGTHDGELRYLHKLNLSVNIRCAQGIRNPLEDMPTLYRDTSYSLTHLIEDIKHGNVALPEIQRPFVWSAAKVRDLFDSMYRGYPVGTLMLWETGAPVGTRQVGGGQETKVAQRLIVDGQQRLTSLFAVLTGQPVVTKSFERRRIRIGFRPSDATFEVTDAAIERDPEYIGDVTVLWANRYKSTVREFMARLGDSYDDSAQDELEERIDRVRDLRDFRFQVIELGASADEEEVAEIFVRTNSKGVTLNQADFILTLMSVHWEEGRRQIESFCREAVDPTVEGPSPKNPFLDPKADQLLRAGVGLAFRRGRLQHVYSILRGKDLDTGDVSEERRAAQFEKLRIAQDDVVDLNNWHEFLRCLGQAGFRLARMITSENAVIYSYLLWLIGKRDFRVDRRLLRAAMARWFFMAHTTGRYSSSPETQVEADLARLSPLSSGDAEGFCAVLDGIVRSNFTGDYWDISLPNRLDTSSARSPVLFAYWAALNILDAEVLFSRLKVRDLLDPATQSPRGVERHHLFPKAYLASLGVASNSRVNAIANMAFVDWSENVEIGAKCPIEYWPAMTKGMAKDVADRQRRWHALPVGWEQLDYGDFLVSRRALIAQVIRDAFERLWGEGGDPREWTVAEAIGLGESQFVEFKSTARLNLHTKEVDRRIEHAVVKTVCGFLNGEGGTLFVGVDDGGAVLGLDADMATLRHKTGRDAYELFLRQCLDNGLSSPTATTVAIAFHEMDGRDVCAVSVAASGKPVFAKAPSESVATEFWVRVGNATKQMHGEDMMAYRSDHWD